MNAASLAVSIANFLVPALTAYFVWRYLQETQRIRHANEAQLEAQIAPAIVIRVEPAGEVQLLNLGSGPALHIRLSAVERGSTGAPGLDRLTDDIDFVEVRGGRQTAIRTTPGVPEFPAARVLNGRSLQCQYSSLSGRTYWTVADFDHGDNNKLIATRFRSSLK